MDELLLETYCPTCEALSIIYESMESDSRTFKSFVHAGVMMESGASDDIVMESVGDIFKTIANGLNKFIQKVKEFFKKILLYITSAYQDLDKLSEEVKKIIKDKDDIRFKIDGFKFTVMDKSGPNTTEFHDIVSSYNEDMAKLSKLKESEIKKSITAWLEESNLDRLRGQVLGNNERIPEDEFLDEIRSYYRNGEISTSTIEVTKSMVMDIIGHAKRLEDLKKSSIKDRDTLINLLTKSESFFGRTIYSYYKGSEKQINVSKVNVSDDKFSTEDNNVNVNDELSKIISMYASYKAKQVNKIAGMINLVACERVNALRDQIKQERTILRKCLFGSSSDDAVKESVSIFPDTGYHGSDYPVLAMESNIQDYKIYEQLSRMVLLEEAQFIVNSIKSGEVFYLMEADTNQLGSKVKNTIADIIESIVKTFREKAIGNVDKYKPWLDEISDGLKDKAKTKKELTMANFVDANYSNMAKEIQNAISIAYKSTKYDDVSFATSILNTIKTKEDLTDPNTRTLLLNYFRTGKAEEKLATKTMNGAELSGKVDAMVKYIQSYGTTVTQPVDAISKALKTATESFKVTESMITGDTYLDIISAPVCESDVVLCKDYNRMFRPVTESFVMEAEIGGDGKSAIAGEANKSVKQAAKAASAETKNGEDIKNATSVKSEDNPDAKADTGIAEKKTNNEAVAYKKAIDGFFKYCITLYMKAREEQFLSYVNVLSEIDGAKPQFDKNGKYVPKASKQKDDADAVKAESK